MSKNPLQSLVMSKESIRKLPRLERTAKPKTELQKLRKERDWYIDRCNYYKRIWYALYRQMTPEQRRNATKEFPGIAQGVEGSNK